MRYFLLSLFLPVASFGQNDEIKIAPWLNGAKGAYTIMHDDFCMAHASGIAEFADSIATAHSIVFDFPVVTNHCDSADWSIAKDLIKRGHEISNHSHNHYCGLPVSWCPTGTYDSSNYNTEYNLSTQLIYENTGIRPTLFIYPFDLHTGHMHDHLMNLGYKATRSGPQTSGTNHPDSLELERLGFQVLRPEQGLEELNDLVDRSILFQQWGIRVSHGVNDASWGSITLEDYEAHMSYLESKVASNDLWVTTIGPIHEYLSIKKTSSINLISKTNKSSTYNLQSEQTAFVLTLQLKTQREIKKITCNNQVIESTMRDGFTFFNIITENDFTITYK